MKSNLFTLALLLAVTPVLAQSSDEAAIKAVLEGHTQAAMDDDAERAVSYFADSPHAAISYQQPGSGYIRGHEAVKAKYREVINRVKSDKSPDKSTTGEYLYRIVGNTAFVTYVETRTKPDGTAVRTHKANYLEKEAGQWKMIGNFWMPEQKAK
ncbi:MAG: nuclear transport factor 2 family protein [Cytophagaceae bacterium]|nr:nuclear transport factor 2 family protein [Cytophagaceae bacterium]